MAVRTGPSTRLGVLFLALGALVLLTGWALADTKKSNTAVESVPRDRHWVKRHEGFVTQAQKGDMDVLFLGDSITDGWRNKGLEVWNKNFEPLKAANFGIGGDRTQHVLWRLQHGELTGIHPKVAVLMIGTNNLAANTVDQIAAGIKAIVEELRGKLPETKILLLGIFPRDPNPDSKNREKIKAINKIIAHLDDGRHVRYLDIGPKFLDAEGNLSKSIMPDYLHPDQKGYEIWAEAIREPLKEMLNP
ncbi:MAG: GDSL family lipase [Planctomycetes bacterium]|nr:GDSL family lipase [Planctomycetota bacterium]